MRDIAELTEVDEPGWPFVVEAVAAGPTECVVLPGDPGACRTTLLQLQVTARSLLGAVVLNSGGLVLHHGWLRVYGGSGGELAGLAEVNGFPAEVDPAWAPPAGLVVGHDVLGGEFALNGMDPARSGRPGEPGQIVYFAPDTLEWETFDGGYSHWLMWMLAGGLAEYYSTVFWPSWREEAAALGLGEGIAMYPPLWSAEGSADIAGTSRKPVPMPELVAFHADTARQLG
ncbi:DUF2625 family protein [Lentzea albidocapillata]|uniref:DUF2625 domain-containing protein n=1 Tax=Lentzea albidocapillata TaxID=40571 RepID=A0A1W2AF46_9PSEU|nr:DUF2625 family protein [Lentzea albidocapillata]SMC59254.1 Protein of unknown function DUF2625 [Lentzea albidocapillata]